MDRYYTLQAADEPNSYHVYDRETFKHENRSGHACVAPYLSRDEADAMTARLNAVKDQEWAMVDDGKGGRIIRGGASFAEKLEQMGAYDNAREMLANTKIGDCINTGVSGYERIK